MGEAWDDMENGRRRRRERNDVEAEHLESAPGFALLGMAKQSEVFSLDGNTPILENSQWGLA